jgi:cytochrome c oxidase subunit 2
MGHATIEWVYVGVVISLLTWVGAESWNVERLVEHVPAQAETIRVTGQQWFWTFEHEDGKKETGQLHVKQGVPYKFELVSKDVIHDFNVPDYTILMDAVPGRVNVVWNLFDEPGEYPIQCREYCGFGHSTMRGKLFVEPQTAEVLKNQLKVKMLLQLQLKMLLQLQLKMLLQLQLKMLLQLQLKMLLQLQLKMLLQLSTSSSTHCSRSIWNPVDNIRRIFSTRKSRL